MSSYKKYKSTTGVEYNFYVRVDEKERFVSLNKPGATLIVRDFELAKAIENSNAFKSGKVALDGIVGDIPEEDKGEVLEPKEYPGVTNMGDVTDILKKEYGIAEKDIALKADALAKAKELGITFPDWK